MDVERTSTSLLHGERPGPLGVGLWRSPLKQISTPPWAPRLHFASLTGGKSSSGWRNLWILGGDSGKPMNDIWRSVDGGASWEPVTSGPHWCPRARLSVCGAATDPRQSPASSKPIGIMYVVGGQTHTGLLCDVWASDTAGRSWHRMTEQAPFGPRCDVACAVVPPDPMGLVVAGGISVDYHRDVWLSRDAGETFSAVDIPALLPPCVTLVQLPPDLLCAARSVHGELVFWKLKFVRSPHDDMAVSSLTLSADLEVLDEYMDDYDPNLGGHMICPPRLSIDVELKVALSWNSKLCCLVAQKLTGGNTKAYDLTEVTAEAKGNDTHILCDMDAANVGWEFIRHGRVWVLTGEGRGAWASDRKRFREHEHFIRLLGMRLAETHRMPWELWLGRVRPMLLPFRLQQNAKPRPVAKVSCFGAWRVIHKPRVAVRKEPSTSAGIVGVVQFGSEVTPLEIRDGWLRVECGGKGQSGWMLIDGASVGLGRLLERAEYH